MRLIVFDVDGTLIDSQAMILAAMTHAFEDNDLRPPSRERTLSIVGLSLVEAMTALVDETAPIDALIDAYKSAFADLRRDPNHHEPMFPGMRDVVTRLAARDDVLLGIATGKSRRGVDAVLGLHSLSEHFFTIQTADDHPSKPNPSMLLRAMADVGARPRQTAFVGDTSFDMEMARVSGAAGIGTSWGYHPVDALKVSGAETIVETADDIEIAVDALLGSPTALLDA